MVDRSLEQVANPKISYADVGIVDIIVKDDSVIIRFLSETQASQFMFSSTLIDNYRVPEVSTGYHCLILPGAGHVSRLADSLMTVAMFIAHRTKE